MLDTKVGQDPNKANPADVAKDGFDAMMAGQGGVGQHTYSVRELLD